MKKFISSKSFKPLKIIFLLLFSLIPFFATAQGDSLNTKKKSFMPSGFRVGIDLTPLSYGILKQEYLGNSGTAELIFNRSWVATAEFGAANYQYDGLTGRHNLNAKGQYLGLGLNYNLLNSREDMALIGFRFAQSNFSQSINYLSADTIWSFPTPTKLKTENLRSNWLELAFGLRVRVFRGMYLANSIKVKVRLNSQDSDLMTSFSVPGFGSAGVAAKGSFQLSLMYLIWQRSKNFGSKTH